MLSVRRLKEDVYLFVENESLLWGFGRYGEEFDVDEGLKKCLKSKIDDYSNRIRIELVELHPTHKCNLSCEYCYIPYDKKNSSSVMEYSVLKEIFEKVYFYAKSNNQMVPRIMFHGGEPLLCKDLIIKAVKDFKDIFKFSIQTNALLIDDEIANFFEKNNVSVGISLDAMPNSRGVDNGIIYSKLKSFSSINKIGVVSTVTKRNVSSLPQFIEELYNAGLKSVVLNPVSPEQVNSEDLVADIEELVYFYKKAVSKLIELNKKSKNKLVIDNIEGWLLPFISDYSPVYCRMSPCGAARLNIVIGPDGEVYPCSGFVGFNVFSMGNIIRDSIEDIINSKTAQVIRSRNVDDIPECKTCAYKRVCGANCMIPLWFKYKDVNRISYYCKFYQEMVDFLLMKIYENEENLKYLISDTYLFLYAKSVKYKVS